MSVDELDYISSREIFEVFERKYKPLWQDICSTFKKAKPAKEQTGENKTSQKGNRTKKNQTSLLKKLTGFYRNTILTYLLPAVIFIMYWCLGKYSLIALGYLLAAVLLAFLVNIFYLNYKHPAKEIKQRAAKCIKEALKENKLECNKETIHILIENLDKTKDGLQITSAALRRSQLLKGIFALIAFVISFLFGFFAKKLEGVSVDKLMDLIHAISPPLGLLLVFVAVIFVFLLISRSIIYDTQIVYAETLRDMEFTLSTRKQNNPNESSSNQKSTK